jgi:hypothetical protein
MPEEIVPTDRNPRLDLTTKEGLLQLNNFFDKYGCFIPPVAWIWLAKQLIQRLFSSPVDTAKAQTDMACAIIKAAKAAGVESVSVTVEHQAGINLGLSVEGLPLQTKVGAGGKIVIEARFPPTPTPAPAEPTAS